jgi:hypothetical protein
MGLLKGYRSRSALAVSKLAVVLSLIRGPLDCGTVPGAKVPVKEPQYQQPKNISPDIPLDIHRFLTLLTHDHPTHPNVRESIPILPPLQITSNCSRSTLKAPSHPAFWSANS